ncbi:MAG: hypothetical protein JF610_12170 [Acidobacteria bacterium]|nr:hypothetical protein [Acidobacteriota bacterium]
MRRVAVVAALLGSFASVPAAFAQVTPAAGYTPPDDTPSIKVGVTIYTDFTYQQSPEVTDADGNVENPSSFNVARSYINITGNINHIVNFRVTPDITRESGLVTLGPGGTISNDSLVFRIKYAFAQVNLDDWMTKGSWARFGIHQMPLLDYEETIYRYRFQGTTFTEREGFYNSSDAGASFHYNIPSNYGDVHVGVYNGEGYTKVDPNDQKAIEVRGTVRPLARSAPILRGIRLTGFYFADNYMKDAERRHGSAVGAERADPARHPPDRLLLRRQLHQGCRTYPGGRRSDVRVEVPERRLRRDQGSRSAVDQGCRRRVERLVVVGDAAAAVRVVGVVGSAAALRPPAAEQRDSSRPDADDRRRRLLVPEPGRDAGRAAARLRRPDIPRLHARTTQADKGGCSCAYQFLTEGQP